METDATRTADSMGSADSTRSAGSAGSAGQTVSGEEAVSNEEAASDEQDERAETTVEVKCTGHVRTAVGEPRLEFTFAGTTLRAFLDAFFAQFDVADLLIAETEEEATTDGWADAPEDLPGEWAKNPEGEQTRTYARVAVNGQFNEHLDGLDTELTDGDRVSLMYPFIFCC